MTAISQSEVAQLLQCSQKWAFGYGDLAGFPLRPKVPALRLREGRAWGAAVQAWHTRSADSVSEPIVRAHDELMRSLDEDAAYMESHGVLDEQELADAKFRLKEALVHYAATSRRLNLVGSEVDLEMPHADGWTYRCHLDGVHQDEEGYLWVVEFKWRSPGAFTPLEQIQLWRQVRWYALALMAAHDLSVAAGAALIRGVIVDERLNDAPSPVRYNKADKYGHRPVSATQSCTLEAYLAACAEIGQDPHPPTVERLTAKVWQQRHEVFFRPDELEDALRELESAEQLLRAYRSKWLRPIRNPGRICSTCAFLDICPDPKDARLRDALYAPATEVAA